MNLPVHHTTTAATTTEATSRGSVNTQTARTLHNIKTDSMSDNDSAELPVLVTIVENSQPSRRRPGRGLVTLLTSLLTVLGITIFAIKETRRAALVIFLPIYSTYLLCYICFLCCVKNSEEENDELEPAVLKEYLEKKKRRRQRRKKKKKVEPPGGDSSDQDNAKDNLGHKSAVQDSSIDKYDNTVTVAESLSLDNTVAPTTTEPDFDNNFLNFFPALSKSFEEVESQFHTIAMQIQNKIRPPAQCYQCRDGTHEDVQSTVCSHNHTPVVTEAENYMTTDEECGSEDPESDSFEVISISSKKKVNLTGTYKLVHNHNFMEFLKSQNIPVLFRKAANAAKPVHTLYHDGDRFDVQVDGIIKGSASFVIDGPPSKTNIRHLNYEDHATYVDDGQALQVRKVATNPPPDGAMELIVKRELGNNGHNLIMSSKARYKDGSESLESVQTFHRIK